MTRAARLLSLMAALWLSLAAVPAQAIGLIRDAEIERTLRMLSDPVLRAAGISPSTVDIYVVNDRSLNAFVAGGRNIFLHSGLLLELETPEELIAVIAHETGHLAGGHQSRRAIALRNAQGPALIGLLAGIAAGAAGGGEAGVAAALGSQQILQRTLLRYNRGEEAAADQAALDYLDRVGVDPQGLLKVLEAFRGQEVFSVGNVDPYVLTHPLSTRRLQLIERAVDESRDRKFRPLSEEAYWHGRMRAKLDGFLSPPERVLDRLEGKDSEDALYAMTVALHRLPAPREAVAMADRLLARHPDDAYYIELKGQILFESADAARAVPLYRRASQLAPDEPLLKAGLGRALLALDDKAADAEALRVLREARDDDPGDAAALRDLAVAYSRAGDVGMATLATAERNALIGEKKDAVLQAKRAMKLLPEASPGWLRAQDLLALETDDD